MDNTEMDDEFTAADIHTKQTKQLPVDRGWAWIILAAGWVNAFLVNGIYKTFGIVFIEIQQKYGASASKTSLIAAFNLIGFGVCTIFVQTIGLKYFSARQTVITGSVIMCIAYVLSAFSPVVELLMLFQGFLPGAATALIFGPTSCLVGQYFDKKRGMAMCMFTAGGGVGTLAFSLFLRTMLDVYSLSGTLLLTGAICLHGMISGALQRPLTFYSSRTTQTVPLKDDKLHLHETTKETNKPFKITKDVKNVMKANDAKLSPMLIRAMAKRERRLRTYSQTSQGSMVTKISSAVNSSQFWRFASTEFSSSILEIDKHCDTVQTDETEHSPYSCSKLKHKIKTILSSVLFFEGMTRPVFFVNLISGCLITIGCGLIVVFLPAHAKDIGLSGQQGSLLITTASICDVIIIPFWGIIADRHWVQSRHLVALSAAIVGLTTFFLPLYVSFSSMLFYSVMYGLFGRVWFSMMAVVLVDLFGLENLNSAIGIQLLCQTVINAIFATLIGLMRDTFGSYVPCYHLMSAVLIAGSIGMLSFRFLEKCEDKAIQEKHEIEV